MGLNFGSLMSGLGTTGNTLARAGGEMPTYAPQTSGLSGLKNFLMKHRTQTNAGAGPASGPVTQGAGIGAGQPGSAFGTNYGSMNQGAY